jgi:hypothetical protein
MSVDLYPDRPRLCAHCYEDGRRCRLPRRSDHPCLCHYHARKEAHAQAAQQAADRIAYDLSGECIAFRDVSAAIAHTISAVASGHLKTRTATTIAYLCQSLVQSAARAESEHIRVFGLKDWEDEVMHTFNTSRFAEAKKPPQPEPPQVPPAPRQQDVLDDEEENDQEEGDPEENDQEENDQAENEPADDLGDEPEPEESEASTKEESEELTEEAQEG